jgi:capsular exopolysaccharide synthesis family protein
MDLKNYITLFRVHKWIIITNLVVIVILVVIGTLFITPIYSASATLRIATTRSNSLTYTDFQYADRLISTYAEIATSRPILEELANDLNLSINPDVEVSRIGTTELIRITVKNPDPKIAQDAANDLAQILVTQSQELYAGGEKSTAEIINEQLTVAENELNQARSDYEALVNQTPNNLEDLSKANLLVELKQKTYDSLLNEYETARVQEAVTANIITIVEPAVLPLKPSQPKLLLNIGLGIVVGLIVGIGIAFLYENLNPRLHSLGQIETISEHDIFAKIPFTKPNGIAKIIKRPLPINSPDFRTPFQKLQTKISNHKPGRQNIKTMLFTSAVPGEGKSTIVANLAIALASSSPKVIVVDGDLHIPVQHKFFGLPNYFGLTTLLTEKTKLNNVIQKSRYANTWVLTSGPNVKKSLELLASPQMKSVIEELKITFDFILIDTPALLPTNDAIILSSFVEGIFLITRQDYCKIEDFKETCRQISDLDSKLIGVIVNDATQSSCYYYSKYHN